MVKDSNLICDAARGAGMPLAIGEAMRGHYVETAAEHGSDNMTAPILTLEGKVGLGEPRSSEPVATRASTHRHESEEHTSELQSLMRHSYAGFRLQTHTHLPYTLPRPTNKPNN